MRARLGIAALALLAASAVITQSPTYTIVSREGRRPLPLRVQNGQEMFALTDLAAAFNLTVREDVAAGGIIVTTSNNRTIVLTPGQTLASAAGRVVSMPAAPVRDGRVWLVPVEFVNRVLGLASGQRLELRKPSRLILSGDVRVPQVSVSIEGDAARARVNVDIAPSAPRAVTQEGQRLIVRIEADALDLQIGQLPENRDLVAAVRPSEAPQNLIVDLGPKAGGFQSSTQTTDRGDRLTIEVAAQGATTPAPPTAPTPPTTSEPPPLPDFQAGGLRTIVVDPGHGGEDPGARGSGGAQEKDLTLALAHRLKAAIESRLGVRVLLTRDGDRAMRVDERAALANNNKADLFISLHANTSPNPAVAGAEVFTLAREGYSAETAAPAPAASLPVFGGGARSIEIIPWDTAQMTWLPQSERLSRLVHGELSARVPMNPRAIDKAPFRVLIGANMPAVLVEAGFLSNPDQEKALASEQLQNEIVQALVAAIIRFRDGSDAQ